MRDFIRKGTLFISLLSIVTGCGATLSTKRVRIGDSKASLNGLVVNQKVPYSTITVVPTSAEGKAFEEFETSMMLPSREEVYVVGYRGQFFTSRTLEVELHPDTTIKRVKVASEAQTEQMFNDLTTAATQAAVIAKAVEDPKKPEVDEDAEKAKALCRSQVDTNLADAAEGRQLTYPNVMSCE